MIGFPKGPKRPINDIIDTDQKRERVPPKAFTPPVVDSTTRLYKTKSDKAIVLPVSKVPKIQVNLFNRC